jgi:glutathione S-transferase
MTVFGETEIGMALNPLLAAHFGAPDADKRNWTVRTLERRVEQALAFVVGILGSRPFLAGNELTLADISVSSALGIWRGALGKPLPAELVAYQDRMAARPAYQIARARSMGVGP